MRRERPVRNPLYRRVAERIRAEIVSGRMAPGEALPTERQLSDLYGVSRTSIREALRRLQAQGLVNVAGGSPSRTTVTRSGPTGALCEALISMVEIQGVTVADLAELRCAVESAALMGAAARGRRSLFREATREFTAMSKPGIGVKELDAAHDRFHVALARASGNEALPLVMVAVGDAVAQRLQGVGEIDESRPMRSDFSAQHAAILESVRRGDGDIAARLTREHVTDRGH